MTTFFFGIPDFSGKKTYTADCKMVEAAYSLRRTLVGKGKPIQDVSFWEPEVNGYVMPDWAAIASYCLPGKKITASLKKRCRAFATGTTSNEAVVKAMAEGFERYALELRRSDRMDCANDLNEPFLDPRVTVPFASYQYKILKGIEPFDPKNKIDWVAGIRKISGERVWVPSDLVFYDNGTIPVGQKVFYQANSSGVAAHFNKQIAIETALYELIERDTFCVTWYGKRQVKAIPHRYFSSELRERISRWENFGYKVSLLDLTLDGPPVVLAVIWSHNKRLALCTGAGCRSTIIEATTRAFNEAEFMAMTWQGRKIKRQLKANEVHSTDDHGLFYMNPKNLIHVDWLLKSEECDVITKDFIGDFNCFDPIVVDITPKIENAGLSVIRVFSEKLMPINFGYGSEHRGHSRMDMLRCSWSAEYPSIPHFFT